MTPSRLPNQRAIVDRRSLTEAIAVLVGEQGGEGARPRVVELLRGALADGRTEIARRLAERPTAGHESAETQAFLIDQLVRVIHDHVVGDIYRASNRSSGERLAVMAVGGYGRGEMAPHSDLDIAFLTPIKQTPWCEQVIEAMLYFLWDLGLKVGHSSRSLDDMVRMGRSDLTIRTAMLEGRYVWGDQALYEEAQKRFWAEVVKGTERQYVAEKLGERNERHLRLGDSRYVVEPNVKEGKGGLRDLHTLYWIGKYIHKVRDVSELVEAGLLTQAEYRQFRKAENFFWAVRCHLHTLTGRAEDRLTFDLQREVAARMNYTDRPGKRGVERFMQYFFIQAKVVGTLTGVFLAQLDGQFSGRQRRGWLAGFRDKAKTVKGYRIAGGRVNVPSDDWFGQDPVRLLEIFVVADAEGAELHPDAMRLAARDAKLIGSKVRSDPRANALFMDLLTSRNNPESVLRWLNEAGIFGRFVPDFGRVNAQMQFDMYHHYTVDEHTIRAIGLLARIEKGEMKDEHPLGVRIIHDIQSRRALYVAVLLHDIAKGRGGDHSELGAEIALKLGPRLGLDDDEIALVSWLVRYHLLLSDTAMKRDLADWKTIGNFVAVVESLERLRQLTLLTIVDIRAVGPGVWNSWKRQLIHELYDAAEERIRLGHVRHGRAERVAAKKQAVAARLGADEEAGRKDRQAAGRCLLDRRAGRHRRDEPRPARHGQGRAARHLHPLLRRARGDAGDRARRRPSRPVLPHRRRHPPGRRQHHRRAHPYRAERHRCRQFPGAGPAGRPFMEAVQLARLRTTIEDALANRVKLMSQLAARPLARPRADAFEVRQRVEFDNQASNRFTVIEVSARDRPALLNRLARALFEAKLIVHSAHIATYGERAVDTFYVTDLLGEKVEAAGRLKAVEQGLLTAAGEETVVVAAA